ncbi:MAG: EAL domain-containing protein [Pseudomonadales bacterium]|nr:EAL domain-containing protein [Pseudomonadales bacterium]
MPEFGKSKILIVDDKKSNRRSICRTLEGLKNIEFVLAESGEIALKALFHHQFAVILLDVNMPGMSGYETAEVISGDIDSKDTPILMVTAQGSSPDELIKAYDAGAVDYITKPIVPRILEAKVKQFVSLDQSLKKSIYISENRDRILNAAGEGVIDVDHLGYIRYCNSKSCRLLAASSSQIIGSKFDDWFSDRESDTTKHSVDIYSRLYQQAKQEGLTRQADMDIKLASGTRIPVEMNCTTASKQFSTMTLLFQDITERLSMEQRLLKMANFDVLTSLPNRAYFYSTLGHALKRQDRLDHHLAVLAIDLDHFKYINDSYGHDAGDRLLRIISGRLLRCVRECDLVARMGGDEFSIVLYDVESSGDVVLIINKILEMVSVPINLPTGQVSTSASIGIALYSGEKTTLEDLLKNADTAMYEAKADGRNNYKFFAKDMQEKENQKQQVQVLLQRAVSDGELSLVYQPKVSLSSKRMVGCEALLRWNPASTILATELKSPAVFIPIAEESGQINLIGEWVLEAVFRQVKEWLCLPSYKGMTVSINVSTRQLMRPSFYPRVEALLESYKIPPSAIEFEVTETGVLDNVERVIKALQQLRELGARISIDDFGTGNSSLDHLRKLPFDILKIDRSFIKDIGVDRQDEEIIKVVMAIAKTMGLEVIAEGAETQEQLAFLDDIKCEYVQGFFFSKPLLADDLTRVIVEPGSGFMHKFAQYHSNTSLH